MFSIFEKLRFIFATKLPAVKPRKKARIEKPQNKWVTILKRTLISIVSVFGLLFIFGLFLYYTSAPSITVDYSYDKKIYYSESTVTLTGYVSSGNESTLKINGRDIELVNGDFAHAVTLNKGDNRFIFEATNNKGTTKELYIINFDDAESNQ